MAREHEYRQALMAKRAENEKQLCNYILGRGATGATVKEMSEDLGWKADTVRSYIDDLLGNGYMDADSRTDISGLTEMLLPRYLKRKRKTLCLNTKAEP